MDERQWFAVRTKPRKEFEAESNLAEQGFEVWLPKALRRVRHARREVIKPVAFFPGYLFVHLTPEQRRWHAIRYTRGVIDLVHFGEVYPPVPEAFVLALRAQENEDGFLPGDEHEQGAPIYRPGEIVEITHGAFAGLVAQVLAMRGKDRVIVLLQLLQQEVRAELPREQVRKLR